MPEREDGKRRPPRYVTDGTCILCNQQKQVQPIRESGNLERAVWICASCQQEIQEQIREKKPEEEELTRLMQTILEIDEKMLDQISEMVSAKANEQIREFYGTVRKLFLGQHEFMIEQLRNNIEYEILFRRLIDDLKLARIRKSE